MEVASKKAGGLASAAANVGTRAAAFGYFERRKLLARGWVDAYRRRKYLAPFFAH